MFLVRERKRMQTPNFKNSTSSSVTVVRHVTEEHLPSQLCSQKCSITSGQYTYRYMSKKGVQTVELPQIVHHFEKS